MATRSFIGIVEEDKIKGIYCHWDGYISHNGEILYKHYNNIDKIKELIELGGLSILAPNIHPNKDKVHNFDNYQDDVVVAYHRDRGEDKEILIFENAKEIQDYIKDVWIDYTYIFKDNEWYVVENIDDNNMKFYKLSDLLDKKKLEDCKYIEYNMKAITNE